LNIWHVAKPVVEDYIKKNLGPRAVARDLAQTAQVLARFGPRLPGLVEAALIRQSTPPREPPRPGRLLPALWVIGAGFAGAALALSLERLF